MLPEQDNTTPRSNDSFVIYPYRYFRQKFDQTAYSKALIGQGMTSEDISKVLSGIEAILGKKIVILSISSYLIVALFMLSLLNLFVLSNLTGITSWSTGSKYEYFVGLFLLIIVLSTLQKRQNLEARALVQDYLDKNTQEFVSEGLKWHLPPQFPQWIELRREDSSDLASAMSAIRKITSTKRHVSLLVPLNQ